MTEPATRTPAKSPGDPFLDFNCPASGASVPTIFSVCGGSTQETAIVGVVVKCLVQYLDSSGKLVGQCLACVPDASGNWCCTFDLSADPPLANASLALSGGLFDADDKLQFGPVCLGVTYDASSSNPCSCKQVFKPSTWTSPLVCPPPGSSR
jgi:hypothetical protein